MLTLAARHLEQKPTDGCTGRNDTGGGDGGIVHGTVVESKRVDDFASMSDEELRAYVYGDKDKSL